MVNVMHKVFYLLIALCGFAFNSCADKSKLGMSLEGEWTAGSLPIQGISAASAVTTESYVFVPDSGYATGSVNVTGMFSVVLADTGFTASEQKVSTTVAGKSIARGNYKITKSNEMLMEFALDSIEVEFDPSTVILESNTFTGADSANIGGLTQTQVQVLKAQLLGSLQAKYAGMRVLDDVKVKGDRMSFKVLGNDYYLTR